MNNNVNNNESEIKKEDNQVNETSSAHTGGSHGSGHHSSHRSRRHHHSRRKRKAIKLNNKIMWAITLSLLAILTVFVVVFEVVDPYNHNLDDTQMGEVSSDILVIDVINSDGILVKDAIRKYLLTDLLNSSNADVIPSTFYDGDGRLDEQVPVGLKLSTKDSSGLSYKIELADNERFEGATVSYIDGASGTHEFKNLYSNTQYYYRVTVYTRSGVASRTGSFKTADTPRILSIDGLSNVRDIGNWRTEGGKRIKQGLLIRGTEMDGAVESGYHLTNEGLKMMLDLLGIKTDIDLRAQTPTSMDALGSRVSHKYYDMEMYSGIFTDAGKEKVRAVFSDLANPDNYPIYLHCTYGCDRTGTICYLLEAVLGVSRGDCLRDYGLSNMKIANIKMVEEGLKEYGGDTLKEQAEAYLISCGVSEYQIESIRNIFLAE